MTSSSGRAEAVPGGRPPLTRGMTGDDEPEEPAALPPIESLFAVPHYALVIGIDAYAESIGRLAGAVDDATAVAAVLSDPARTDRFAVTLLTDQAATLEGIKAAFADLWGLVAANPAARVVLYFAGHGVSATAPDDVDATTPGYFLPQDAVHGTRQNWLAMADVQRAIGALGCHHLLLVLDCCFAGAFRWFATRAASPSDRPLFEERVRRYLHDPAWHVITSAAHDEKALDSLDGKVLLAGRRAEVGAGEDDVLGARSPFARALVMALRGDADLALPKSGEPDGILTGSEIQVYVRACFDGWQAQMERPLQRPLFFHWPTRSDKGEFVFLNPDPAVPVRLKPAVRLIAANNPYRGLEPHTHDPARPYFFGRDALTRDLVARVTAEPVVVVLGSSGSGKSSLVFAGLLPALAANGWRALPTVRPRDDAARALADLALAVDLGAAADESLAAVVARHVAVHPDERLVVVVDQLEELVTLGRSDDAKAVFLGALDEAAVAAKGALRVVYTLRSDYEPQFAVELIGRHPAGRFRVTAMGRDELREVIEGPAEACVFRFDPPTLVDEMVNEVAGAPGALALLSFTLSEMYLRYARAFGESGRDDRSLTLADYVALGRVEGSLTLQAERVYAGLADEAARRTLRRVLLRMVAIEGGLPAKRRVRESELVFDDPAETERALAALAALTAARLVVRDASGEGASAEPAHDRIVLGWPRLRVWLDAPGERARREAVGVLRDWLRNQQGVLDRDVRLDGWRAVLDGDDSPFNREEGDLLRRSAAQRADTLRRAEEEVQRLQVALTRARDQARMSAARAASDDPTMQAVLLREVEEPGAIRGWLELVARVLDEPIAAVVYNEHPLADVIALAFSADGERVGVASSAFNSRTWRLDGADSMGGEVHDPIVMSGAVYSPDLETVLWSSVDDWRKDWGFDPEAQERTLENEGSVCAAYSRSGDRAVTAAHDGTVRVWRTDTGAMLAAFPPAGDVVIVALSPDGSLVATGGRDGTVRVRTVDGAAPPVVHEHRPSEGGAVHPDRRVHSLAFSSDGREVLSATRDAVVHRWRADGEGSTARYVHDAGVDSAAFCRADDRVVTTAGGRAFVWSAGPAGEPTAFSDPGGPVKSAALSDDGDLILTVTRQGTTVWLADGSGRVAVMREPEPRRAGFSPGSACVVSVSADCVVRVWRLDRPPEPSVWLVPEGELLGAAIVAGRLLALTASPDDHTVSVRCDDGSDPVVHRGHAKTVRSARLSDDGALLVTTSDDGTARVWQTDAGGAAVVLEGHQGAVTRAEFSRDGRRVVTASADRTARVWSVATGREEARFVHERAVVAASFSMEGDRVITGHDDAFAAIWSVAAPGEPVERLPAEIDVTAVAFRPDGRVLVLSHEGRGFVLPVDAAGAPARLDDHLSVGVAACSPDGRWVVEGLWGHSVGVESVADGRVRMVCEGHTAGVTSASFADGGARLVTSSRADRTVQIWIIDSALARERLRRATSLTLRPEERERRLHESSEEASSNWTHQQALQDVWAAARSDVPAPLTESSVPS